MKSLRPVEMVAFSVVGIRPKANYANDVATTEPLDFIAVAVAMTALLLGMLSTMAQVAVHTIS